MKRKLMLITTTALLLLLALVGTSSAALPGSGWWSAFVVQNIGTGSVTVGAEAIAVQTDPSSTVYSFSDTVGAGASKTFHPAFCGGSGLFPCLANGGTQLPAGFVGSVVLNASGEIAAAVQVGNNQQGTVGTPGGTASAQYNGKAVGGTSLGFPIVKHNFFNKTTTYYIQAAGSPASVTATYQLNNGTTRTDGPHSISANRTYVFDPAAAGVPSSGCGTNANTSPCVGAVTFTSSSGDIVGTVVEHQHSASPGTIAQSTSLFAGADEGDVVYCPVFKNAFPSGNPRTTGMTVQNVGGSATDIRITIEAAKGPNTGSSYTNTVTNVAPGSSVVFFPSSGNIGGMPGGNYGAVTVEARSGGSANPAGRLVASVNEANFSGTQRATTYGCFAAGSATSSISLPIMKEDFVGSRTGIAVQNISNSSTTINATFTCDVGGSTQTYTHVPRTLGPRAGLDYYNPSSSAANWQGAQLPNGVLCAVSLSASGGANIVAIAQEAAIGSNNLDTKNYEGFNVN